MLRIKHLSAGYGQNLILSDFSLDLEEGEIYALIGPSGCGKSTLLKVLCGILPVRAGSIEFHGQAVGAERRLSIGYVPQNYGLLDWKTIQANIMLPLRVGPAAQRQAYKAGAGDFADIIAELGLGDLLKRYPQAVSGGQKQRAALARAFLGRPDILLMDEPFSALDAFTSQASQALFLEIWRKRRVTTLFITHNMAEAAALGTRILLMDPSSRQVTVSLKNSAAASGDEAGIAAMSAEVKRNFRQLLTPLSLTEPA